MQETPFWSLGLEDPLEKEMATHSSILAWRILWTEKTGRLQAIGSHKVRHWVCTHPYTDRCKDVYSSSLLFSCSVVPDCLRLHELLHTKLPCPSLSPRVCSNSCPLIQWCHPTIPSSVIPLSSHPQSFPASEFFPVSRLFTSGGQRIGASVLSMNSQDWFPLGLAGLISLQSKGLSRVFSSITVQKHWFFGTQPSLWSNSHIHMWLLEKP